MVEVKTETKNLDRIEKECKYLSSHGVKVGVLGDNTDDDGVKVKDYATWLITGTQFMPPRDFMSHKIRSQKGRLEISRLQRKLLSRVFRGEITGKQCLNQLGIAGVQMIKNSIMSNEFVALKPSTVKYKTRNKNNILRDSDTLLNSIAFEVVKL